jgi:hypothetical protein
VKDESSIASLLTRYVRFPFSQNWEKGLGDEGLPMQDAYIFTKWKLFGLLLLSALFGVVVGRKGPDLRRSR